MSTFIVTSGQALSGITLGSGDVEEVLSGGTANNTLVNGGFQLVGAGGTATGTMINSGYQDDFGSALGTTVNGGIEVVERGGLATSTTINGGYQADRGTAIGATINSGGMEVVELGGTASGTTINGGTQDVFSGSIASNTTVYGGVQVLESGGIAIGTTINGGFEDDRGMAIGTTINSGGVEIVERGGAASGTTINGGIEDISSRSTASNTTIQSGEQLVEFGGAATGTTISGGVQLVSAGGTASNTTITGGVEYVYAGGTANGVTFGGPAGMLQLQDPGSLIGTISGWQVGDIIDFSTNTMTNAAISGPSLQVTFSNGQSLSYQIAGQQAGTIVQVYQGNELRLVQKPPPAVTAMLANDTGTSNSDSITFDPTLTGSGDPNATVGFTIDGTPIAATATADANGHWSYTPTGLADGPHTVVASETDAFGNTGSTSLSFTLDTDRDVAPSFVVAGGAPIVGIAHINSVSFAVGGLDDETGRATFTDGSGSVTVPISASGTFSVDLSGLALNQITSSLSVGDIAGNSFAKAGNAIIVDPGPTAGAASIMVAAGASTDLTTYLLGLDKPGIVGDMLSLSGEDTAGTAGMVTLANGNLIYTAPSTPGGDSFGYTVADQYDDTASSRVTISAVSIGNIGSASGTVVLGNNSTSVGFGQGTVTVLVSDGNVAIAGGNASNAVIARNGNDSVSLGGGNNTIILGGGNDTVTVGDGNNTIAVAGSASSIDTVKAGAGNNTMTLGAGHEIVSVGGGNNTLILGNGLYDASAGHGTDLFVFSQPEALLNLSFSSNNDQLVFRNSGFDLGMDNGLGAATPQPIAASLFSSHTDGSFASPDNRFAYDSVTGKLYYDPQGSTAGSTAVVVADLTNHPHFGSANLFFTS